MITLLWSKGHPDRDLPKEGGTIFHFWNERCMNVSVYVWLHSFGILETMGSE